MHPSYPMCFVNTCSLPQGLMQTLYLEGKNCINIYEKVKELYRVKRLNDCYIVPKITKLLEGIHMLIFTGLPLRKSCPRSCGCMIQKGLVGQTGRPKPT